jgi:hypothetical protein
VALPPGCPWPDGVPAGHFLSMGSYVPSFSIRITSSHREYYVDSQRHKKGAATSAAPWYDHSLRSLPWETPLSGCISSSDSP